MQRCSDPDTLVREPARQSDTCWQPDPDCLAAGDHHADIAMRAYAAARMSDWQIARRLLGHLNYQIEPPPRFDCDTAAEAVARHCAIAGMPRRAIIAVLAYLAAEVPAFLDDPGAIAALVRAELAEAQR